MLMAATLPDARGPGTHGINVGVRVFTLVMAQQTATRDPLAEVSPWPALFALCLGFFMILVDTTIVTVATPAIIADLHADVNSVVWVTSAYLLAYAVPGADHRVGSVTASGPRTSTWSA